MRVHGQDRRDPVGHADVEVILTVAGRDLHDAGTVLSGHEVAGEHGEDVRVVRDLVGEEVEHRRVVPADQGAALDGVDAGRALELLLVRAQPRLREDVAVALLLQDRVVDVLADDQRHVRHERPRHGRPGQDPLAGLQLEPDGRGRVLAVAVGAGVHPQLGGGQRGLAAPAVGQHPERLVDQALVVERLERPHDALHEGEVEGLVVVVEVDPARLAGHVVAPLVRVAHDRGAAHLVELLDAERLDLGLHLEAEFALGLDLGRQAVAVPAEPALDPATEHGLQARHRVLDVAGEQVAVVRQTVGEGRTVVEDELVLAVLACRAVLDAGLEGVVLGPVVEHAAFQLREGRLRRHTRLGRSLRVTHGSLHRRSHRPKSTRGREGRAFSASRGTTPLALTDAQRAPLEIGCDGPTRPGLLRLLSKKAELPVLPEAPR